MPPEVRNQTSIGNRRLDPVRDQYTDSSRGRDQQPESVTTPRRSLFKLKLLSALDKLPFIRSATNHLTENTVPNSTEYRTAQCLQTVSKPNSSPGKIAESILNTLPVDYTKEEGRKTVQENMKEQIGQLSDRQLYRAEKRMNHPKMQAVIAELRAQAKQTSDVYKGKILLKTAQNMEDMANVAKAEMQRRGYPTHDTDEQPTSLDLQSVQKKSTLGMGIPKQVRFASPSRELRVFNRHLDKFTETMRCNYTLTGSQTLLDGCKRQYEAITEAANQVTAWKEHQDGRSDDLSIQNKPIPLDDITLLGTDDKPVTTKDGITWPQLAVKDCGRGMAISSYVPTHDGKLKRVTSEQDLAGLDAAQHEEEIINKFYQGLKEQFGDDPVLLYKIGWAISQDAKSTIASVSHSSLDRNEQGRDMPEQLQATNTDKSDVISLRIPGTKPDTKYTLTQDDSNVYIEVKDDMPTDRWFLAGGQYNDILEPGQTSLIGQSRIVVPKKKDEAPRLEHVTIQAHLCTALAD